MVVMNTELKIHPYVYPGICHITLPEMIFKDVCDLYKKDPGEVRAWDGIRKMPYREIRQVTMTLMRYKTKMSWAQIGSFFNQDHATAMNARKKIVGYIETDKQFREFTDKLFKNVDLTERKYERVG